MQFRLILIAIFIFATNFSHAANKLSIEEIEKNFIQSQILIENQKYNQAKTILKELYLNSYTLRIELEYARVLYLLEEYDEAKRIFDFIYSDPNTPYEIRNSVIFFIESINYKIGYIKPNFSLFKEKNPGRDPGSAQYLLFGNIPVNYNSGGEEQKTVKGSELSVKTGKILTEDFFVGFDARSKFYLESNNEKNKIDDFKLLANYKFNKHISITPSYYRFEKKDQDYEYFSNNLSFFNDLDLFDINYNFNFGYKDYRYNKNFNSDILNNSLGLNFIIKDFEIKPSLGHEIISAKDKQYSLVNTFKGFSVNRNFNQRRFLLEANYLNLKQNNHEIDLLWNIKRKDDQHTYSFNLCDRNIFIFSHYVCLGYFKTINYSNNDFYNYKSNEIRLTFRK